jgi:hypothetical protein
MRAALAQRLKTEIAAHPGRMCYAGDRYQTAKHTHLWTLVSIWWTNQQHQSCQTEKLKGKSRTV